MDFDNSFDIITPDIQPTLSIGGVGGLVLPNGTTAQRPSAVNGTIRYNTDTNGFDLAVGSAFRSIRGVRSHADTGISATGSTQAGAFAVTAYVSNVTTTGTGTGVVLPTPLAGDDMVIVNRGANALLVYPPTGGAIGTLATNVGYSLGVNKTLTIIATTTTQWEVMSDTGAAGSGGMTDPGSNGILSRTALNTTAARTITGTTNQITVTNGDGVSGNPTISLPTTVAITNLALTGTLSANASVGTAGQLLTSNAASPAQWRTLYTVGTSAPGSPLQGDKWINTDLGIEFTYINDGNTSQWVETSGGIVGPSGSGGGGGGSLTTGTATINFGAFPGTQEASVVVTGQTSILADSKVDVYVKGDDTSTNHSASDHTYLPLFATFVVGSVTASTGFTIYARSTEKLQGQFTLRWAWS